MDPKELAAKYAKKCAEEALEKASQKLKQEEMLDQLKADAAAYKKAFTDVVIPFMSELQQAFPKETFSYRAHIDLSDNKPVGVSFKIGDMDPIEIISQAGKIAIIRMAPSLGRGFPQISCTYSPNAEPYISSPGDLTREKIANLVAIVMEDA
jgi:hypothetical protein